VADRVQQVTSSLYMAGIKSVSDPLTVKNSFSFDGSPALMWRELVTQSQSQPAAYLSKAMWVLSWQGKRACPRRVGTGRGHYRDRKSGLHFLGLLSLDLHGVGISIVSTSILAVHHDTTSSSSPQTSNTMSTCWRHASRKELH
jgi:hypothetical protein